jgi:riboflavin kinase/FMN adenylyltransferase
VVVGEDYRFGQGGHGDLVLLEKLGSKSGFEVVAVPLEKFEDEVISSTRIRASLEDGLLEEAVAMLGHYPILAGKIIPGLAHGAKVLGYPTANIELEDNLVIPKSGVYACFARFEGKRRPAVANIGYSPTFHIGKLRIEVHILEFDENIMGQRMEIELVKWLRDEKEFLDEKDLAGQIGLDIDASRRILEGEGQ